MDWTVWPIFIVQLIVLITVLFIPSFNLPVKGWRKVFVMYTLFFICIAIFISLAHDATVNPPFITLSKSRIF